MKKFKGKTNQLLNTVQQNSIGKEIKVALYSDLHLEFESNRQIIQETPFENKKPFLNLDKDLDYLFLAGDIATINTIGLADLNFLFTALREQVGKKTKIIYIAGNHEFYHTGIYFNEIKKDKKLMALCQQHNIILLDKDTYVDDENKVAIFGATLWQNFNLGDDVEASKNFARSFVYDYSPTVIKAGLEIFDGAFGMIFEKFLTPEYTSKEYFKAIQKLKKDLSIPDLVGYTKIVVTHFLPDLDVVAEEYKSDKESLIRGAYWASKTKEDILSLADYWFYGHSHGNFNIQKSFSFAINDEELNVLKMLKEDGKLKENCSFNEEEKTFKKTVNFLSNQLGYIKHNENKIEEELLEPIYQKQAKEKQPFYKKFVLNIKI